jgi:hypothetical protein
MEKLQPLSASTSKQRRLNKRAIKRGEIKVVKSAKWIGTIRGISIQQLITVQQAAVAAYPGAKVQCKAIKSVKGTVFEATLSKFKSGKPQGCTFTVSEQDAIDRVIGYVMYIHAGYKDESATMTKFVSVTAFLLPLTSTPPPPPVRTLLQRAKTLSPHMKSSPTM